MLQFKRMKKDEVQALLKPSLYQVFLMSCPSIMSFGIARHHWFVVNKQGDTARWEVLVEKDCCGKSWGHLHTHVENLFMGTGLVGFKWQVFGGVRCDGRTEGEEGSVAHRIIDFLEASPLSYPHCHTYSLLGPNSNSYAQWVLDHFTEFPAKLPWNALGKSHKVKFVRA